MSPYRRATEKQLAALTKARAALTRKHTCERCGLEDPSRGLQKHSDYRIYETLRDGEKHRYCISCRIYFRWIDIRQQIEQELHTLFAEHTPFYVLDTEATGKLESRHCQVVEIAVVNQDGQVVYHSLCKPDIAMPSEASEVSGITDVQLADAPPFTQIWPSLLNVLTSTEIPVYTWNADFDSEAFPAPCPGGDQRQNPLALRDEAPRQVVRGVEQWQERLSLPAARMGLHRTGIEEGGYHRAIGDALNALRVLRAIGSRVGKHPPPADMPYHQRYYGE
jgi:DNA polymerase III subunit epsilon